MLEKPVLLVCLATTLLATLVGCGATPDGGEPALGGVALKITGNVGSETAWSEEEVRSMDTIDAQRENNEGELSTYTGVAIKALLEQAGVSEDATTVIFVAEDDSVAELELGEVQACDDCIVSSRNRGGFSIVMPGYSGKLQIKGVVEIRVE